MLLAPEQFERILRTLQGPPVTHEKRRVERFLIGTRIEFARARSKPDQPPSANDSPNWTWTCGLTHDISEVGVGLVAGAPAETGQRILIRIPDGGGGLMTVLCRVSHCEEVADGLYGLGLEFIQRIEQEISGATAPLPAHMPLMPLSPGPTTSRPANRPRGKKAQRGKLCCGGGSGGGRTATGK